MSDLYPEYFETHFRCGNNDFASIREFAIITAYATTGEQWPEERNKDANEKLHQELKIQGCLLGTIIGFSHETDHEESSWVAEMGFDCACDIGLKYKQDAIYYVRDDMLFVSLCDDRRELVKVGPFSARLTIDSL
jgi:hypothetical protein